jgi:antirestriction protein ArdC
MRDLHTDITNDIIAAIESGVGSFIMPWHGLSAFALPQNAFTDGRYRGINRLILLVSAKSFGYAEASWATYRQWQRLGHQVAKGETGVRTIMYKPMVPREDGSHEDEDGRQRVYIRAAWLFNIAQIEGYVPAEQEAAPAENQVLSIACADALVAATGARIVEGGTVARYEVFTDKISMPDRSRFDDRGNGDPTSAWYNTLFHELIHWTGAAKRLIHWLQSEFKCTPVNANIFSKCRWQSAERSK